MLVERERIGQEGSRLPFGYYLEKDADLLTVVPMARSRQRAQDRQRSVRRHPSLAHHDRFDLTLTLWEDAD